MNRFCLAQVFNPKAKIVRLMGMGVPAVLAIYSAVLFGLCRVPDPAIALLCFDLGCACLFIIVMDSLGLLPDWDMGLNVSGPSRAWALKIGLAMVAASASFASVHWLLRIGGMIAVLTLLAHAAIALRRSWREVL